MQNQGAQFGSKEQKGEEKGLRSEDAAKLHEMVSNFDLELTIVEAGLAAFNSELDELRKFRDQYENSPAHEEELSIMRNQLSDLVKNNDGLQASLRVVQQIFSTSKRV